MVSNVKSEALTLTFKDAARLVGVSEWTLRRAVRAGQVPVVRVGSRERIPRLRLLQQMGQE